jgi:hypothetical protein
MFNIAPGFRPRQRMQRNAAVRFRTPAPQRLPRGMRQRWAPKKIRRN